jgi:hypothetical protein
LVGHDVHRNAFWRIAVQFALGFRGAPQPGGAERGHRGGAAGDGEREAGPALREPVARRERDRGIDAVGERTMTSAPGLRAARPIQLLPALRGRAR